MRDQTIENNGCEGEYNNCDSNAIFFPFNYSNTSDNRACKPVSDFISDKLKGFFPSPLNDNFVTNLL